MPPRRSNAVLPARFEPQLATLVKTAPEGDGWLHEIKFDGYRIGARVADGAVTLFTRAGNDWTTSFPEVRAAVAALPAGCTLLDGEVAAVLADGRTSFQALQRWFSGGNATLVYYVFDLLHLDGEDVARLPLDERKARLERLLRRLPADSLIRYSAHVVGGGRRFLAAACERGLEGIVSKRRDRPYEAGRKGGWTKSKCLHRQELVIGGFTDPEGQRGGIGALLLGVYDGAGALRFAGKVGTGFSQKGAADLRARLDRLERSTAPFAEAPPEARRWRPHWVEPALVAEVAFAEWTDDGRLRQASFQGLRTDKAAREVMREEPAADDAEVTAKRPPRRTRSTALVASATVGTPVKGTVVVEGVRLTHPERVLYPDLPLTKLELARFYGAIADWVLPHVVGRPLSLLRCPTGLGSCFYVKHATTADPGVLRRIPIREKDERREYAVVDDLAGLMALVQMSILEIHTWNARADDLERPDRVIIDLDPGPDVGWPRVLDAAELVRVAFETLGLRSFVKTTGGKGLHVVVPFTPERDWETCLGFARGVSEAIVRQDPKAYTTTMTKRGREKKILLDYYRNHRGATAIAAFSTRARAGAPVAVPLAWDELSPKLRSDHFTVRNVTARLRRLKHDPWREYWTVRQRISAKALAAVTAR
ncbi:MAG: DNA ligase D [Deltaproteobacteria bacterium]|nr:DNA ligase D [Deltaproteobacteria bacterium]